MKLHQSDRERRRHLCTSRRLCCSRARSRREKQSDVIGEKRSKIVEVSGVLHPDFMHEIGPDAKVVDKVEISVKSTS